LLKKYQIISKPFLLVLLGLFSVNSLAETKSTGTLPKGIRSAVFKQVSSKFTHKYTDRGESMPYTDVAKITLDAKKIAGNFPQIKNLIKEAESLVPGSTKGLNFGTVKEISGEIDVDVRAIALAYGVTDSITVFGMAPFWKAEIFMKDFEFEQSDSMKILANVLRKLDRQFSADLQGKLDKMSKARQEQSTDYQKKIRDLVKKFDSQQLDSISAQFLAQFASQFQKVRAETLQRVIQDMGYAPVGSWSGSGIGDVEAGVKWNYLKRENISTLLEVGVRAPTGRKDDPDIIQDIPFGDGQWDVWTSLGVDYKPLSFLRINQTLTGTVQLPDNKMFRTPEDANSPLTERYEQVYFDLGDSIQTDTSIVTKLFWRFSSGLSYTRSWKGEDNYIRPDGTVSYFLNSDTKREREVVGFEFLYSSVEDYQRGVTPIPMMMWVNLDRTISGRNVPDNDLLSFTAQFFF
jgi:hypothetical protein